MPVKLAGNKRVKIVEEIIRGCQSGKRSDQQLLYEHFSSGMFAVCMRYTRDTSEAEDILHEGFIKVFENIDRFRGEGSFEGWMRRIMVNLALERYRRQHKLYPVEDISEESGIEWEGADMQIRTEDLLKMISLLSPRYRMVFNLYAIEGYSHKEIAEMMGISEGTSKSNLARARGILQRKVNASYSALTIKGKDYEQRG